MHQGFGILLGIGSKVEISEDDVDDVSWLRRRARHGGGSGESQSGQSACEDHGELHLDCE